MERKWVERKEVELRLDEEFNAILNMIGEGGPDYARNDEDIEMQIMKHDEAKSQDLH
ncbi:hypothetical protein [Planococcus rifietoensis]|uniref:hypothetical protein n=1 Tax=Planococcus rifietoensis TaxID=200991 RepID=UPI0038514D82